MIITKYGDLLEAKGVIVHGCNAQGVMGSGVAKQIKKKWPKVYRVYRGLYEWHDRKDHLLMGKISWWGIAEDILVVNMITQLNYGRNKDFIYVDYEAVRKGFHRLNLELLELHRDGHWYVKTVNFPLIGCGLANGDWEIVSNIIDEELDDNLEKVLWIQE